MSMNKSRAFVMPVVLLVALAIPIIWQQDEIQRLRATLRFQEEQFSQLENVGTDESRLSNLVSRTTKPEIPTTQTPREILRLRGEVARLRRVSEERLAGYQAKSEELDQLQKEIEALRPFSPEDSYYAILGINTNDMPNLLRGANTNQVLAELQRVGAKIFTDHIKYIGQDKFIHAEVPLPTTNNTTLVLSMFLHFDDGKLTTQGGTIEWQK